RWAHVPDDANDTHHHVARLRHDLHGRRGRVRRRGQHITHSMDLRFNCRLRAAASTSASTALPLPPPPCPPPPPPPPPPPSPSPPPAPANGLVAAYSFDEGSGSSVGDASG